MKHLLHIPAVLILFLCSFFIISCQQDEFSEKEEQKVQDSGFAEPDGEQIEPYTSNSSLKNWVENNFLLNQIADKNIEVCFINRGDVDDYKYLSIHKKNSGVRLHYEDDASGRQRWNLRRAFSNSYYLTSSGNKHHYHYLWGHFNASEGFYPRMFNYEIGTYTIAPIKNTNYYTLSIDGGNNFPSWVDDNTLVIAADGYNTHELYLLKAGETYRKNWELKPVDNFIVKDGNTIRYTLEDLDKINVIPNYIDEITVENKSTLPQSMTLSYSKKATYTSSYSHQYGITVGVSSTIKVGIPNISDGALTSSFGQSNTWSFSSSETREDTRNYSFPLMVAPMTKVVAKIIVARYDASLTYTVDAIGEFSGKSLTIKGKWKGIALGKVKYDITAYDLNGTLKSQKIVFDGTPSEIVNIGY